MRIGAFGGEGGTEIPSTRKRIESKLVKPGTLERTTFKAKRVEDRRGKV